MADDEESGDLGQLVAGELASRVIECSVDGILAFDRECRYTLWNPAMERIAGLPAEATLGRSAFELFPFLVEIGEDRYFHDALAGRHVVAHDRPFRVPATGREGFFEGHYAPLRDPGGEVVGGLAVIRDITARRRALDELEETQEQLVQASKLAAMGQMGAGIAHELNQPLTGLKMLVSMIRDERGRTVGEFTEELDLIAEQIDRLASIVGNWRGFARKSAHEPRAVDVRAPLDKARALLAEPLRLAEVTVEVVLEPDLPALWGDEPQLQQVFLNLLHNALDAFQELPSGAPRRIQVSGRRHGERVAFAVADNGPGVAPEARAHLFDPFFTTKPPGRGTGLGLSVTYGIVRSHGGRIAHRDAANGGAEFTVELPAAREDAVVSPSAEAPSRASRSARILVVDDEPILRHVLAGGLDRMGYAAEVVPSAEEALAAADGARFDLALVDLHMPGIEGVDLCARLRAAHPDLAVVAMSGFASEEQRRALAELGVADVLAKPFSPSRLEEVLRQVLGD